MKKIILLALLVGLTGCGKKINSELDESICRDVMFVAESVMDARQNGLPLSKALEKNDELNKVNHPEVHQLGEAIIRDAYAEKKYYTPELRLDQKNEFAAKYYEDCMK